MRSFIQQHLISGIFLLLGAITGFWYFNEANVEAQSTLDSFGTISLEILANHEPEIEVDEDEEEILVTEELAAYYADLGKQLKSLLKDVKGDIGITYVDLETKQRISINGDQFFHGASTMKVPLVMFVSDKVANGELNWDDRIEYEKKDFEDGTGTLQYALKASYPLGELAKLSITVSDNIAKNMLYDVLGGNEEGIKAIYLTYLEEVKKDGKNQITAKNAAKILEILYQESETNENYKKLITDMQQTTFSERLETAKTTGHVAHKIGSYEANVHDIGIFYGDHPYILTVYTNKEDNAKNLISKISDKVWDYQKDKYPSND